MAEYATRRALFPERQIVNVRRDVERTEFGNNDRSGLIEVSHRTRDWNGLPDVSVNWSALGSSSPELAIHFGRALVAAGLLALRQRDALEAAHLDVLAALTNVNLSNATLVAGITYDNASGERCINCYRKFRDGDVRVGQRHFKCRELAGQFFNEASQLLNIQEDLDWLKDTHLKGLRWNNEFLSAILIGNEDAPDRVELFAMAEPSIDDEPIATFYLKQDKQDVMSPAQAAYAKDAATATGMYDHD